MTALDVEVVQGSLTDLRVMGAMAINFSNGKLVNIFPPSYRQGEQGLATTAHTEAWPTGDPEYDGGYRELMDHYNRIGAENEFHVTGPDGAEHPLTNDELAHFHNQLADLYNTGEELLRYTLEIDPRGSMHSLEELETSLYEAVRLLARQPTGEGTFVYPGSTMPGADYNYDYFNKDPHIQRMINNVLNEVRCSTFTAVSTQFSFEVPSPLHALRAAVQTIPAITAIELLGQSSPASGPKRRLNASELLVDDGRTDIDAETALLKELGADWALGHHAVRTMLREFGLSTGGVIKNIPPLEAMRDQASYMQWLAETAKTRVAGRQLGDHTVRVRGHQPTGAIEHVDPDSGGMRVERLMAIAELTRKVTYLAMDPYMQTPEVKRFITSNWADVFLPLTRDETIQSTIAAERRNRIRQAMHGKETSLEACVGDATQAAHKRLPRLVEFLDAMGCNVTEATKREIMKALQTLPSDCGDPLDCYYRDGTGTFSEAWQVAYEREHGLHPSMGEQELMRRVNLEASHAFQHYAAQTNVRSKNYAGTT